MVCIYWRGSPKTTSTNIHASRNLSEVCTDYTTCPVSVPHASDRLLWINYKPLQFCTCFLTMRRSIHDTFTKMCHITGSLTRTGNRDTKFKMWALRTVHKASILIFFTVISRCFFLTHALFTSSFFPSGLHRQVKNVVISFHKLFFLLPPPPHKEN